MDMDTLFLPIVYYSEDRLLLKETDTVLQGQINMKHEMNQWLWQW